jgi:predicted metal-dependent HD superfamily phosphohydrolase
MLNFESYYFTEEFKKLDEKAKLNMKNEIDKLNKFE